MMMTFTLHMQEENIEIDIIADRNQRIYDTLQILEKGGRISLQDYFALYSARKCAYINPYLSYAQAGIENADKLRISDAADSGENERE